jgi:hypothetical protein
MVSPQDTPQAIMAQAQALVEQVERELEASEEEFRRMGIDREQLLAALEARMTDAQREQMEQEVQAHMDNIEREMREERTRQAFVRPAGNGTAAGVKRRRNMV